MRDKNVLWNFLDHIDKRQLDRLLGCKLLHFVSDNQHGSHLPVTKKYFQHDAFLPLYF